MKLGIAGFGYVGQAVMSCMKSDENVLIYDPPKRFHYSDALKDCYAIFCCLPTEAYPCELKQDFSVYDDFFEEMKGYKGILIIKSTVIYENVAKYFDKLNIVLNPEFLNQNTFQQDFYDQDVVVLGGRVDLSRRAARVYEEEFKLSGEPKFEFCSAEEACWMKYLHNIYHAYKILFWNYVEEVTGNQRKVFQLYSRITKATIGNEMARLCADGKPGFGGPCFPKDLKAFHDTNPHDLTEFMIEFNQRIRGE